MQRRLLGLMTGALAAIMLAVAPAGAADFKTITEDMREGLEPVESRLGTVLVKPGVDLADYEAVYLEPVEYRMEESEYELRTRDEDYLAGRLARAFEDAFEDTDGLYVSEVPGEGVVAIQFTITDAIPNRDLFGLKKSLSRSTRTLSVGIGGAEMEAIFRDSQTGDIIAIVEDRYRGRTPLDTNINTNTRWGDARDGFRLWARETVRLME